MKSIARGFVAALFATAMAAGPMFAQTVTVDYDHTVNFLKVQDVYMAKMCMPPTLASRSA